MISYVVGDILETQATCIVQQVNCCGAMGAGLAKQIATKWPCVKEEYLNLYNSTKNKSSLLGKYLVVDTGTKFVINIFGQLTYASLENRKKYGYDHVYTDYRAVEDAFSKLDRILKKEAKIAFPYRMGCGLANGSWSIMYKLIEEYFGERNTLIVSPYFL